MKIMIVTPYYYPKTGGLENYAQQIARGLKARGHEVLIVTTNHEAKQRTEQVIDAIRVIRLPIAFKFSNTPLHPLWYWWLRTIIKQERPDIINAHAPVPGIADAAIFAAGKTPTALTYHAATLRKPGSLVFNTVARLYELAQKPMLARATAVVAVSDYVRECFAPAVRAKTHIVYNAIDPSDVPVAPAKPESHHLVFVAGLDATHAWKGLDRVLEAVSIAVKTTPGIRLTVLGDGNRRAWYEQEAQRLGIADVVTFAGHVAGADKYRAIQRASAMVVYPTTANDAFPTVMIEAWACGVPVIAARIGALTSLVANDTDSFLVEPDNAAVLAKRLTELLADPARLANAAVIAQRTVRQKLTWQQSCAATEKVFEAIR
jgi:glycosyltransferase involved in cell wall biosynthesis